jgi:hypothetical protein
MVPSVQQTHQQQYRRIRIVTALLLLLPVSVETSSSASSSSTTTTQSSKKHNNAVDSSEPYYASLQGRLKLMRRCESTIVYVNRIYLTCDSPGEWNEEASSGEGYRQSSRCKYGDQANAYIFCKYRLSPPSYGRYCGTFVFADDSIAHTTIPTNPSS